MIGWGRGIIINRTFLNNNIEKKCYDVEEHGLGRD